MPCYEVQMISVKFKAGYRDLLMKAITATGMVHEVRADGKIDLNQGSCVLDLEKGTAEMRRAFQSQLNRLKRAYSNEAIKLVAKTNLWMNKTTATDEGRLIRF